MRKVLAFVLALTLVAVPVTSGCATFKPNPTQTEIQQVRVLAVRIADASGIAAGIANSAGEFIAKLPIADAAKNDYDCAVVRVMGTSQPRPALLTICGPSTPQGPGPLPKALGTLKTVSTHPGLKATVQAIVDAVTPLLTKLDASTEAGLRGLAIGIRASLALLQAYLGGTL